MRGAWREETERGIGDEGKETRGEGGRETRRGMEGRREERGEGEKGDEGREEI